MSNKTIPIFLCLFAFATQSSSQSESVNPGKSFAQGEYTNCIELCDEMLQADVNDKTANFFKGAALVKLKKYKSAKLFLATAKKNNYQPQIAINANLLRVHAGLQDNKELKELLGGLAENGFGAVSVLNEKAFDYLNEDKEFNDLKTKVDANANPCKYGEQYQRLDFWLGEWDVYVNNKKTASSSITKSEGGCTLHEDYKTATEFFGRSMNYFDPKDEKYTQIWIDKFNSIIVFKEVEFRKDYLLMSANDGAGNLTRMSYLRDTATGHVTQTMEASTDNGETWKPNFLGVYKPKNND